MTTRLKMLKNNELAKLDEEMIMELSEASKNFKRLLPTPLQSIANVSMKHKDYFSIIINNLIEIYGDYANPKNNLELYLKSEEYHNACRRIKSSVRCQSLPLKILKEW